MSKTYLIITCCINNRVGITYPAKRRNEYYIAIANLLYLLPPEIQPIIVENSSVDKSCLDIFKCPVVYTQNSKPLREGDILLHKGSNEMLDIKQVIDQFNIQPEDIVCKITGRYLLFQPDFFTTVLSNPDKDCFFRQYNVCTYEKDDISIVLGLFALRCKYLKVFEYRNHKVGCEQEFREYINEFVDPSKIHKVDKLFLRVILGETDKMIDC
jgi:hypothetical protein